MHQTDSVGFYRNALSPIDSVFQVCLFGLVQLNCADLVELVPTEYGLCYKLSLDQWPDLVFTKAGSRHGFMLQFMVGDYEYSGQADTPGVGLQVI